MKINTVTVSKAIGFFLAGIVLLLYISPVMWKPDDFFQDDSYFYLQVAHHIVGGHGSTFNTITRTNGFHPLWMIITSAGMFLAGGNKVLGLQLVALIQLVIFFLLLHTFYRVSHSLAGKRWLLGVPILLIYFLSTGIFGSEAHVNGLMVLICAQQGLSLVEKKTVARWALTGLIAGLTVLARLDNIFLVSVFFIFIAIWSFKTDGLRAASGLSWMAVSFTAILSSYLMYNFLQFGHIMPISGAIKSTFPELVGDIDNLGQMGKIALLGGIASVIFSLVPAIDHKVVRVLRILGFGVIIHAAYVVFYTDHYTFWPWYYVSGALNIAFLIVFFADLLIGKLNPPLLNRAVVIAVWVGCLGLTLSGILRSWQKVLPVIQIGEIQIRGINVYRWPSDLARWMGVNLPDGANVMVYDWPGAIAYYSSQNILPVDGLMNDFQYNNDILEVGIQEYVCLHQINYFIGYEGDRLSGYEDVEIFSPLYRINAGYIRLYDDEMIIKARDIVQDADATPPFAIWKINDHCE